MKKQWYDVIATTMATVKGSTKDLTATNAVRPTTTDIINESIINTMNNSHYVTGRWSVDGMGDAVRFYGCLVSYDITDAGPP